MAEADDVPAAEVARVRDFARGLRGEETAPVLLPYELLRSLAVTSVEGALADLLGLWEPGTGPGRREQVEALERARAGMRQVLADLETARRV